MSGSNPEMPVYTITVGVAGVYTDAGSSDVSGQVNAEIAAAPAGDRIVVDFEPGEYGAAGPIKLPSNTSVIGDDSTLVYLPSANAPQNEGLIVNASAYSEGNTLYVQNVNGTTAPLNVPYGSTQVMSGAGDVTDTNIAVQGMTFALGSAHMFGTWFTNAANVDVQNNTYIGGTDGNAFVDVVNALAAQNIAVGQNNGAFDNWDGPVDIAIDDNMTYMSATSGTGWSVLINSTPTGNPNNAGNAVNDNVIGNLFASPYAGALAINANALLSYGATSETAITIQDNIDSMLGVSGQSELGSTGPLNDMTVEQNIISGLVYNTGAAGYLAAIGVVESGAADSTQGTDISGNLVSGPQSNSGQAVIQNIGYNVTTNNNAVLGANNATAAYPSGSGLNGTMTVLGNIENYQGKTEGEGVIPGLALAAPGGLEGAAGIALQIPGLAVADAAKNDTLSVALMVHFGTLTLPETLGVTQLASDGETGLLLTGSAAQIDQDLARLSFTSNGLGWDDAIGVTVTSGDGASAVSVIPVTVETAFGQSPFDAPITLSVAYLAGLGLGSLTNFGTLNGANLTGEAVIAPTGDNSIVMGGSISLVFLGVGDNTVDGGTGDGYIATGQGVDAISLALGGDVTIAGGTGTLAIDAATGNNLIESGTGLATVFTGAGDNTIIGNTGVLYVVGGAGAVTIETLPQGGGTLNAALGAGGGTIFALSGAATIATQYGSASLIETGTGDSWIASGGHDTIILGAGSDIVYEASGAADTIVGQLNGAAIIDVAAGDSLVLDGMFAADDVVNLEGGGSFIEIGTPYALAGAYIGLAGGEIAFAGVRTGDTFKLAGFDAATETYVSGVGLIVGDSSGDQITLAIEGDFNSSQFSISNGAGGAQIAVGFGSSLVSSSIDTFNLAGWVEMRAGASLASEIIGAALFDAAGANLTVQSNILVEADTTDRYGAGIALSGPGSITNIGTIIGGAGIEIFGAAAGSYIDNRKLLDATLSAGIYLQGDGVMVNSGQITAQTAGMLLGNGGFAENTGVITAGIGIEILGGGASNAYNYGNIIAQNGILLDGGTGAYGLNSGQITASNDGIALLCAGSAANYGRIGAGADGIYLRDGGLVYNYGQITAANGIDLMAGGSVFNDSAIAAALYGIIARGRADIDNEKRGTIQGGSAGIRLDHGGIVTNAGLIEGGVALSFAPGFDSRLILTSTGRFAGAVELNGGTLELAAGGKPGTIAGAGLQAMDAGAIDIDAKAVWHLTGAFAAAAGTPIVNAGTLIDGAGAQIDIDGPLSGKGQIKIEGGALTLNGSVAAGQTIAFKGTGDLALDDPAAFDGKIEKFTAGDTILLAGSITSDSFAAGILSLTEGQETMRLTFASPAKFGSDSFVLTQEDNATAITLSKPGAMTMLTPAAPIFASATALPDLAAAYAGTSPTNTQPIPQAAVTIAAPPGIAHMLLHPTPTPLLTLHN